MSEELDRLKEAMATRGWAHREFMDVHRFTKGDEPAKVEFWVTSRTHDGQWSCGETGLATHYRPQLVDAIEATEKDLRATAAAMLARADELAAVGKLVRGPSVLVLEFIELLRSMTAKANATGVKPTEDDPEFQQMAFRMWCMSDEDKAVVMKLVKKVDAETEKAGEVSGE